MKNHYYFDDGVPIGAGLTGPVVFVMISSGLRARVVWAGLRALGDVAAGLQAGVVFGGGLTGPGG